MSNPGNPLISSCFLDYSLSPFTQNFLTGPTASITCFKFIVIATAPLFRSDKCQHNFIRQFIIVVYSEMLNRPHRKSMAEYGIPFRQQKDFRCIIFEIIAECAPFAAAVCKIFVDCDSYFSATLPLGL